MRGYIYILHSNERPDVLKIGKTTKSPEIRCQEHNDEWYLSINSWSVVKWFWVEDCDLVERTILKSLKKFNLGAKKHREAFRISVDVGIELSERICSASPAKSDKPQKRKPRKSRELEDLAYRHVSSDGPYKEKILEMHKCLDHKDFIKWLDNIKFYIVSGDN